MNILRGKRHLYEKTLFCLVLPDACFLIVLWCFKLHLVSMLCCSHRIVFICWTCIHPYATVLYWLHVRMIICFAMWSLYSFPYDCLMYDQVARMFYNMFTWSHVYLLHYTCLLLLALPWGSNVFCASVLDYKYTCSMFITASRFRCEWVFSLFPNSRLSIESVIKCFVTE